MGRAFFGIAIVLTTSFAFAVLRLFGSVTAASAIAPGVTHLDGTFALQEGHAATHGHLIVTPVGDTRRDRSLDLWLTTGAGTVRRYTTDMTKPIHLIAVSDDLTSFAHLHPKLDGAGHFRMDMRFAKAGTWHLFADSEPAGIGRQVFRYDIALGGAPLGRRALSPTGSRVRTGTYLVSIQTTALRAGMESRLTVHITQNGRPARDLHPYLGALAHAVFVNARTLTYAHVHPMALDRRDADAMADMPGMSSTGDVAATQSMRENAHSSPEMLLHVSVREAGIYKMWLQFRGARDALYVAPFVITAR